MSRGLIGYAGLSPFFDEDHILFFCQAQRLVLALESINNRLEHKVRGSIIAQETIEKLVVRLHKFPKPLLDQTQRDFF